MKRVHAVAIVLAVGVVAILIGFAQPSATDEPTLTLPKPFTSPTLIALLDRQPIENAVRQLKRVGAVFSYDGDKVVAVTLASAQVDEQHLSLLGFLTDLKKLDCNACPYVDDATLLAIVKLQRLEELNLGGTRVTDEGLRLLPRLPKLERLYLWRTTITNDGMRSVVAVPALKHLNLWDTAIGDEGLKHLEDSKSLRRLCIGQSIQPGDEQRSARQAAAIKLSQAAIEQFRQKRPECRVFYWSRNGKAVQSDVQAMARQVAKKRSNPVKLLPVKLPPNLAQRTSGEDWASFLGPTSDGRSSEKGLVIPRAGTLPLVWQTDLGEGYGAVAVSRGRLFVMARKDDKLQLLCLNAETGHELWAHETPTAYEDQLGYGNGPRASPVVDGDRVYAYGADGHLYCVAVETGKTIWHVDTSKRFGVVQYFFGVGSSPVVFEDLLITVVGGSPADQQEKGRYNLEKLTGNGTGIVAFNKYDGRVQYAITDTLASYATPRIVSMGGRRWCLAGVRQGLLGFEPRSGVVDFLFPWRAKFRAGVNAATPIVHQDHVFITEAYGPGSALLRFKPGQCDVVWRDQLKARQKALPSHWATPILHEGMLYGCAGRHTSDAEFRCVEYKTGQVVWRRRLDGLSSVIYVDGHIIVVGEYGRLEIVSATPLGFVSKHATDYSQEQLNGRPLLSYPVWSAPVLSHGLLYLRGKDRLICLEVIPQQ